MPLRLHTQVSQILFGLLAAIGIAQAAMADGAQRTVPPLPRYQQECAGCHLAYPPGMLPSASWKRIMATLPKHYGTDASLDPATVKEIGAWLDANAGTYRRVRETPAQDRVTRSAWFIREHGEVSAATWKLPAVKSASNCGACHTQSDQGDFNERNVRIPR